MSVYLRVCVCLSHSAIVSKQLNDTIMQIMPANSTGFLVPKITAKFERDHPLQGRQTEVGYVKSAKFEVQLAIA